MADSLTTFSREFYERAKMKTAFGLYFFSVGCMFMGFTCQSGGQSSFNSYMNQFLDENGGTQDQIDATQSLTSGNGFGCFCFIVAAVFAFTMSLYTCVPVCGSDIEKRILNAPFELQTAGTSEPYAPHSSETQVAQPYTGASEDEIKKNQYSPPV